MNRNPSHRAVADPLTLGLVALVALAAGVFGTTWKPLEVFRPKPPTEQLTKLQSELAAAQAAAEQARKDKDAAIAAERAKLEAQVRAAQQDNAGTQAALAKVPAPHLTPEVKLAASMAVRVDLKLATAIGKLPDEQRDAMVLLIEQALSGKQSEIDEFARKLAERDAAFAALSKERDGLKVEIATTSARAVKAEETVKATQSAVTAKTDEVKHVANQLDGERRKAGSLGAALESGRNAVLAVVAGYLFLAFVLPGLVKHLDESNRLKPVLRGVAGYFTSGLLYHDAKSKLDAAAERIAELEAKLKAP